MSRQIIVKLNRTLDKGDSLKAAVGKRWGPSQGAAVTLTAAFPAEAASQKEAAGIGSRIHRIPSGWKAQSTFLFK